MKDSATLARLATRRLHACIASLVIGIFMVVIADERWVAIAAFLLGASAGINFFVSGTNRLAADGKLTLKDDK